MRSGESLLFDLAAVLGSGCCGLTVVLLLAVGLHVSRWRMPLSVPVGLGAAVGVACAAWIGGMAVTYVAAERLLGVQIGVAIGCFAAVAFVAPVALAALLRPDPDAVRGTAWVPLLTVLVPTSIGLWLTELDAAGRLSLSMLAMPLVLLGARESAGITGLRRQLSLLHLVTGAALLLLLTTWTGVLVFIEPEYALPVTVVGTPILYALPLLATGAVGLAGARPVSWRPVGVGLLPLGLSAVCAVGLIGIVSGPFRAVRERDLAALPPGHTPDGEAAPGDRIGARCVQTPDDPPCPQEPLLFWPADLPIMDAVLRAEGAQIAFRRETPHPVLPFGAVTVSVGGYVSASGVPLARDASGIRVAGVAAPDLAAASRLVQRHARVCGSRGAMFAPDGGWTAGEIVGLCLGARGCGIGTAAPHRYPGDAWCGWDGTDWIRVCIAGIPCAGHRGVRTLCAGGGCTIGVDTSSHCEGTGCTPGPNDGFDIVCAPGGCRVDARGASGTIACAGGGCEVLSPGKGSVTCDGCGPPGRGGDAARDPSLRLP